MTKYDLKVSVSSGDYFLPYR